MFRPRTAPRVKGSFHDDSHPGWLVRWLSPGDYHAIAISQSDSKARFYKRENDGTLTTVATSGTVLSLTSGSTYEAKVVIDTPALAMQRLRFWVDADGDGFGDESAKLTDTTYIDQDWSVGMVGLYGGSRTGYDQEFDDVQVWIDNTGGQTMDDQQIDDNFDSNVLTLTHDDNGNLTDDGVYKYVYDAWNRLVKVNRYADSDTTTVATYAYLADDRRIKKVVQNCGAEETANDGGNTRVHFYYDSQWRVVETRGSGLPTAQYVWGTQYTDELIFVDVNGDPTIAVSNNCNPDVTTSKEAYETPPDARYFYHQDRNWNVVALSEYDIGDTNNGRIVERYSYTPYGQFVVLKGDSGNGEMGNVSPTSTVGNVFSFQGLAHEAESGQHHVRNRMYDGALGRFVQRDPAGYWGSGMNLYAFVGNTPTLGTDPSGLACSFFDACAPGGATGGEYVGATHTECLGPNCPVADDDCPGGECEGDPCAHYVDPHDSFACVSGCQHGAGDSWWKVGYDTCEEHCDGQGFQGTEYLACMGGCVACGGSLGGGTSWCSDPEGFIHCFLPPPGTEAPAAAAGAFCVSVCTACLVAFGPWNPFCWACGACVLGTAAILSYCFLEHCR